MLHRCCQIVENCLCFISLYLFSCVAVISQRHRTVMMRLRSISDSQRTRLAHMRWCIDRVDIFSLLFLSRCVLRAVIVTMRSKSLLDFKPLLHPSPPPSPLAAELHYKLQPSANPRNSMNVDTCIYELLKVYYN